MFLADQPQAHFLARELLKPSVTLLSDLFSWVEQEQEALKQRYAANPLAIDIALESFLELLVEFCTILLQDMAILYHKFPQSRVFSFSPFNTQIFRDFASQAFSQVEEAEKATLENLKRLPQQMEDSIRGILVTTIASQKELATQQERRIEGLEGVIHRMEGTLGLFVEKGKLKKRSKAGSSYII
ncbi:hypothetical protein M422DRAFT_253183 [Sphaerobolus stellatus SS14]|uniref:Ndc10 domain-containing protein n=1 Tax=Sphaerobolus stellatus (strain SS14) TaxID=990650 RepID=A0A0C9V9D8_SPHS4|nr:hypothetical protein M422DRAFT_253183 [Sphaerobolus stellatus SS14]